MVGLVTLVELPVGRLALGQVGHVGCVGWSHWLHWSLRLVGLYVDQSVGWSVGQLVGRSVHLSLTP
jgi:hypothetical protein